MNVSVIATVAGEPVARLETMVDRVRRQEGIEALELVIAAPPRDIEVVGRLSPGGAVRSIDVVPNPTGGRSSGLNLASEAAGGDVVVRVDARSRIGPHHVARSLRHLAARPEVGVVGGVQRPVPGGPSAVAAGLARALANPWVVGAPAYRRGGRSGPADTVYLGAYRRSELRALGGFSEVLPANEDFELCRRYRDAGFVVWLDADLLVDYEARATAAEVVRQYHAFGVAKARYWAVTGRRPNARQTVALAGGTLAAVSTVTAVARAPHRLASVAAVGVVGAMAADAVVMGPAPAAVRVAAVAGGPLVAGAWFAGVLSGLARVRRWRASAPAPPWPNPSSPRRP